MDEKRLSIIKAEVYTTINSDGELYLHIEGEEPPDMQSLDILQYVIENARRTIKQRNYPLKK